MNGFFLRCAAVLLVVSGMACSRCAKDAPAPPPAVAPVVTAAPGSGPDAGADAAPTAPVGAAAAPASDAGADADAAASHDPFADAEPEDPPEETARRLALLKAARSTGDGAGRPAPALTPLERDPAEGCGCWFPDEKTLVRVSGDDIRDDVWLHLDGRLRRLKMATGISREPKDQLFHGAGLSVLIEELGTRDVCGVEESCEIQGVHGRVWIVDDQAYAPASLWGLCGC